MLNRSSGLVSCPSNRLMKYNFYVVVNCPASSKMLSCSPTCKTDIECSGRKCCSNVCNTKSCVPANLKDDGKGSYKNQNSS